VVQGLVGMQSIWRALGCFPCPISANVTNARPLSQWLYSALSEAGLPVICVETRHMRAVLKAQINKTDRNANGLERFGYRQSPLEVMAYDAERMFAASINIFDAEKLVAEKLAL
jgi:hypothetical protein